MLEIEKLKSITDMKMKKNYVMPSTEIVEMESEKLMAGSDSRTVDYTDDKASNDHEALSNGRRGTWGNLWE